jgi:hypothetical protein
MNEPDSDSGKIEILNKALKISENKKRLKSIINACDSIDDILNHLNFFKFNENMTSLFATHDSSEIFDLIKASVAKYKLDVHENFLLCFSDFLHSTCDHDTAITATQEVMPSTTF